MTYTQKRGLLQFWKCTRKNPAFRFVACTQDWK